MRKTTDVLTICKIDNPITLHPPHPHQIEWRNGKLTILRHKYRIEFFHMYNSLRNIIHIFLSHLLVSMANPFTAYIICRHDIIHTEI